jgi:5'-deoxynucleotidase YfbR-like HD superfamily hydrolase
MTGAPAIARAAGRLAELVDLKRVRQHGASVAARGFARAWAAVAGGHEPEAVARRETALALAATRLGAIDLAVLADGGLSARAGLEVVRGAAADAGAPDDVLDALDGARGEPASASGRVPPFVAALAGAPRAGVTAPGRPRYALEPAETHAEHCWAVAVIGALLGEPGDRATPFLCGLAHHLHNAWLPDAGFAGETALGEHLEPVMARFTQRALGQLPDPGPVQEALRCVNSDATPAARAFNAADVLDRVLELRFHARAAAFDLDVAVHDYEIVHEGPLQAFGMEVLRSWRLI